MTEQLFTLGMVDDFQKKYSALEVPYPKDTLSSAIDSQATALKSGYEKFVGESKTRIDGITQVRERVLFLLIAKCLVAHLQSSIRMYYMTFGSINFSAPFLLFRQDSHFSSKLIQNGG